MVVEADTEAQRMVAAYIDLNPVRAGWSRMPPTMVSVDSVKRARVVRRHRRGIARIEG